ncbi:MAG: DinB family protein [Phycisphaeraceae bacterium]
MSLLIESLLVGWNRNAEYASKLVADLSDAQMLLQPNGANHPAWLFSHLNLYHPVLVAMVRGQAFEDPKVHKFGMQSKPEQDAALYGTKQQIIDTFLKGHADVAAALSAASEAALEKAMPLERWRAPFPKVGSILGYLMLVHESTHLGQISMWRRVQGMKAV